MKWVYLATAPNQLEAEMWRDLLVGEGFTVVVRGGDTSSYLGMSNYPSTIMVDEEQHDDAKKLLEERLRRAAD
jgi:hypothetical protein